MNRWPGYQEGVTLEQFIRLERVTFFVFFFIQFLYITFLFYRWSWWQVFVDNQSSINIFLLFHIYNFFSFIRLFIFSIVSLSFLSIYLLSICIFLVTGINEEWTFYFLSLFPVLFFFTRLVFFTLSSFPSVSPPSPLRHSYGNCYFSYYWLLSPLLCPCFIPFLCPLFPLSPEFYFLVFLLNSLVSSFLLNFLLLLRFPFHSLLLF